MKLNSNPSSKVIYFWNMMGNLASAGSSVLYLLIISRMTSAAVADVFSLANGIAAIWVVIGLFQVRTYQGTDINEKYSFSEYSLTRLVTVLLMLLTLYPYLYLSKYKLTQSLDFWVITIFVIYRGCDAWSDLYQGLFQQHERLDIAGKSMTFRYVLSVLSLFGGLFFTKSIVWALLLMTIVNIIFVFVFDLPCSKSFTITESQRKQLTVRLKRVFHILYDCFPLFISGFLLAYIFNEPKQVIAIGLNQGWINEGAQRDFSILFMPAFFMSLFILILRPLVTQMAILWTDKNIDQYKRVSKKLFLSLFGGGILITLLAYLIGTPILGLVFGVRLDDQVMTLSILVFAGILYSAAVTLGDLMTILRKQQRLLPVFLAIFIISKVMTFPMVHLWGLLGAAVSFLSVMLVYLIGNALIYIITLKKEESKNV